MRSWRRRSSCAKYGVTDARVETVGEGVLEEPIPASSGAPSAPPADQPSSAPAWSQMKSTAAR